MSSEENYIHVHMDAHISVYINDNSIPKELMKLLYDKIDDITNIYIWSRLFTAHVLKHLVILTYNSNA